MGAIVDNFAYINGLKNAKTRKNCPFSNVQFRQSAFHISFRCPDDKRPTGTGRAQTQNREYPDAGTCFGLLGSGPLAGAGCQGPPPPAGSQSGY